MSGSLEKTYTPFKDVVQAAEAVYKSGMIPLVCGADESIGANVSTFFDYADSCTVVDCKALFLKKMQNIETVEELAISLKNSTLAAMKSGNWLVLHLRDGATDLKAFEDPAKFPLDLLFTPKARQEGKDMETFAAMEPEVIDPDFKVMLVSAFEEADVEDFLAHLPLDKCQMLVCTEVQE